MHITTDAPAAHVETLVRCFFAAIVADDHAGVADAILAPGFTFLAPGCGPVNRSMMARHFWLLRLAFPGLAAAVEDIRVDGESVVCRYALRGSSAGAFWGIPPLTPAVLVAGVASFQVAAGRMTAVRMWAEHPELLRSETRTDSTEQQRA